MARDYQVYGLGNAIVDVQVQITEKELAELGLKKGGMQLVETAEQQKLLDLFSCRDINKVSGGSAANTIITIAALGSKAAYGCLVGNDALGAHYLKEMASLKIALDCPPTEIDTTGTCVILITPDAERTMNTHLGASAFFTEQHVSEKIMANSDWLYIEGYLFSSEKGCAAVEKALALAKKHSVNIAVTFSDGFIVEVFGNALRSAVKQADLIFANHNEAKAFTGKSDAQSCFKELCKASPNVVMTLSDDGAMAMVNGSDYRYAGVPTEAIDATGAGDVFAGAFLYALANKLDPQKAGDLACSLASSVVSQLGARLPQEIYEAALRND